MNGCERVRFFWPSKCKMFLNMEYDFKYGMWLMIRPFDYYTPQHMVHIYIRVLDKREYSIIIFLFLIETICYDPSSELSR